MDTIGKKKCSKCSQDKVITEYWNNQSQCKICMKEASKAYNKTWKLNNPEKAKAQAKAYYEKTKLTHPEWYLGPKAYSEDGGKYSPEWYQANKEKHVKRVVASINKRKKTNPVFKLRMNIASRISAALKSKKWHKTSKTQNILGCSFEDFKLHLEKQFEPWMNWDNYGKYNGTPNYGWDVDHIIPASSAKSVKELYELNQYTNLQPLCSYINRDVKKAK